MTIDYRVSGIQRTIDADTAAAAKEEVIRPVVFVSLGFDAPTGTIRMNSSPITIEYEGQDYYGVGDAGSIQSIREGSDLSVDGLTLQWSGIDTEHIQAALDDDYQGRPLEILVGLIGPDGVILTNPASLGPWRMDSMAIEIGDKAAITVSAESRMAQWNRPKLKKLTHREQLLYDASLAVPTVGGDLGLEFIADAASKEIVWGR